MAFFMAITDTRLKDSPEGSLPEYEALGNPWTIPLVVLWKSMLTSELVRRPAGRGRAESL